MCKEFGYLTLWQEVGFLIPVKILTRNRNGVKIKEEKVRRSRVQSYLGTSFIVKKRRKTIEREWNR